MYARLWWKDARQFWPIWLLVFLAAAFTQAFLLFLTGGQGRMEFFSSRALLVGTVRTGRRGRGLRR